MTNINYTVYARIDSEWRKVAQFAGRVSLEATVEFCRSLAHFDEQVENVRVYDADDDEVFDLVFDDEEDNSEPSESDLEMGFNPYLGTYDFDC